MSKVVFFVCFENQQLIDLVAIKSVGSELPLF